MKKIIKKIPLYFLGLFGVYNLLVLGTTYLMKPSVVKTENMTKNEKLFLKSIYGDKLDTSGLQKEYRETDADALALVFPFGRKTINICNVALYEDDYSRGDALTKGVIVHEAKHLVDHQHQSNLALYFRMLATPLNRSPYEYALQKDKPLTAFQDEQSPEIVRNYAERFIFQENIHVKNRLLVISPKDSLLMETVEKEYPAARATRLANIAVQQKLQVAQ